MLASYSLTMGELSDERPIDPSTAMGDIRQAARDALAVGVRRHLPDAVGLVLRGVPIGASAAYAHYVLEASPHVVTPAAAVAISAPAAWQAIVASRSKRGEPS